MSCAICGRHEIKAIVGRKGAGRPIVLTAIFTGLRASELRGLRWADELVDPAHQSHIVGGSLGPGPIDPRARHVQQRALPADRKLSPGSLDLRPSRVAAV
jgi:integrase